MWVINAVIEAVFVIFVGLAMLPAITRILDYFDESLVQSVPGLTAFEGAIMGFYPVAIFIAIFLGAVLVFRQARRKKE